MSAFTPRQREALVERVARAVLWRGAQPYERDHARSVANAVVKELDESPASDRAVRRAVINITERMEETA